MKKFMHDDKKHFDTIIRQEHNVDLHHIYNNESFSEKAVPRCFEIIRPPFCD